MKIGVENRKQLIQLIVVGALAVLGIIYYVSQMSDSSSSPAPAPAPVVATEAGTPGPKTGAHAAAQVSNAKLDPTLHMESMLLTESLEYTGNGRNIFSANSMPMPSIPTPVASARAQAAAAAVAPVPTGPPPPPPIDLRFFGLATRQDGTKQAFLLKGEDVFVAVPGDIVNRRYQIRAVTATSVEVTDLQNNNTQRIPRTMQ